MGIGVVVAVKEGRIVVDLKALRGKQIVSPAGDQTVVGIQIKAEVQLAVCGQGDHVVFVITFVFALYHDKALGRGDDIKIDIAGAVVVALAVQTDKVLPRIRGDAAERI